MQIPEVQEKKPATSETKDSGPGPIGHFIFVEIYLEKIKILIIWTAKNMIHIPKLWPKFTLKIYRILNDLGAQRKYNAQIYESMCLQINLTP